MTFVQMFARHRLNEHQPTYKSGYGIHRLCDLPAPLSPSRIIRWQPRRWVTSFLLLFAILMVPLSAQAQPAPPNNSNNEQCFAVSDESDGDTFDTLIQVILPRGDQPATVNTVGVIGGGGHIEAIALVPDPNNQGEFTIYAANASIFGELVITTRADGSSSVEIKEITRFAVRDRSGGKAKGRVSEGGSLKKKSLSLNDVDSLTYDREGQIMYGVQRRDTNFDLLFKIDLQKSPWRVEPNAFDDPEDLLKGKDEIGTVDFVEVKPIDGVNIDGLRDVDDIALHPDTHIMFAAINNDGEGGRLAIVDPTTGEISASFEILDPSGQPVEDLEGLAFSGARELYGSTGDNGPPGSDQNQLFRITLPPAGATSGSVQAESVTPFDPSADDVEGLGCFTGELTTPEPAIDVEKFTNGIDADTPAEGPELLAGWPVQWTYEITNIGNIDLSNVTLEDDMLGTIQCPSASLAVGESMSCSASGDAIEGPYRNLATASGNALTSTGLEVVQDTDPSHYTGRLATIDIEKSTNGVDADAAPGPQIKLGDPVTWEYVVTNTGDVTLVDISVTDNKLATDSISCPTTTMAAGESMSCTAEGIATSGQYRNDATVTARAEIDATGECPITDTDPSHYFGVAEPAIEVEKSTNGIDADEGPGPRIPAAPAEAGVCLVEWTYVVTNTGELPLSTIALQDDKLGAIQCPTDSLAVGESMTCSAVGDAVASPYSNLATVTGVADVAGENVEVSDTDPSHYDGQLAAVTVEKSTNGEDADVAPGPTVQVGSEVTWDYLVTNTGDIALTNIQVTDDQLASGTIDCGDVTTLALGESMTCSATGTAIEGQYANEATVLATAATDSAMCIVPASDPSHYIGVEPPLDADQTSAVGWSYRITNTGEIPLANVALDGGPEVIIDCPDTTLAVNGSMACGAQGAEERYGNMAIATAETADGAQLEAMVPSSPLDGLLMTMAISGSMASSAPGVAVLVDTNVAWQATITNQRAFAVDRITADMVDLHSGARQLLTCPKPSLAAGESMICAVDGAVTSSAGHNGVIGTVVGYPGGTAQPIYTDAVGFYESVQPATVSGHLFIDELDARGMANGRQDPGERPLVAPNVEIDLFSVGDTAPVASGGVDAEGNYSFDNLLPGDYYLVVRRPVLGTDFGGFNWAIPNQGNNGLDSDANWSWDNDDSEDTARTDYFRLSSGQIDDSWDTGFTQITLAGTAFDDQNGNSRREDGELGISGVSINLFNQSLGVPIVDTVVTDQQGRYEFGSIDPGNYSIAVALDGAALPPPILPQEPPVGSGGPTLDIPIPRRIPPTIAGQQLIYIPLMTNEADSQQSAQGGK